MLACCSRAAQAHAVASAARSIATFVISRSQASELQDLLSSPTPAPSSAAARATAAGGAAACAPSSAAAAAGPSGGHLLAEPSLQLRAPSLRELVASCSERLTYRHSDGTPVTYAAALDDASQARVICEPFLPFRVLHINRAYEHLSGWRAAEVRGVPLAAVLQGDAPSPDTLRGIRDAAAYYERTRVMCTHVRKDGSRADVRLSVSPLLDDSGHVTHLLAVVRHARPRAQADAGSADVAGTAPGGEAAAEEGCCSHRDTEEARG